MLSLVFSKKTLRIAKNKACFSYNLTFNFQFRIILTLLDLALNFETDE